MSESKEVQQKSTNWSYQKYTESNRKILSEPNLGAMWAAKSIMMVPDYKLKNKYP